MKNLLKTSEFILDHIGGIILGTILLVAWFIFLVAWFIFWIHSNIKKLALILCFSGLFTSCSLNRVTMREYFSHIKKSGIYEVSEIIGNRAVLRHYADTIFIYSDNVKPGDFISVTVLK